MNKITKNKKADSEGSGNLGEEAGRRRVVRGQPKDNVASAFWNWTGGGQGMRDDGDQTSGERSTVEANPNGSLWNK